jgi:hypothetical protein
MDPKDLSSTEEELEDELLRSDEVEDDDTEYDLDREDEMLEEGGF